MSAEISVVIAAYNAEAYIERAIRSALEWQNAAVEIIVVNDASTDNTSGIVSGIGDPRVKLLTLSQNGGPSVARNAGFAMASAPWIAVLDGDDAFLPNRLLLCLTRARAIDADIVVDNINIYREADQSTYPMFAPHQFSRFSVLTLANFIDGNHCFLGGSALGYLKPIFKTEFLRKHELRYDPALRIGEDYLLMCEALASGGRCAVVGTPGYLYTVRAGSISHRLTLADLERIADGDKKFLAHHKLDLAAARAQKRRNYAVREARAFIKLVDAIKARDLKACANAIAEYPPAALHLWRPVWVRMKRLFKWPRN